MVNVLKYLGAFAQIAAQWETLKHREPHVPVSLPMIRTRIGGRMAKLIQNVEFEE